jgi:hypothetical protein
LQNSGKFPLVETGVKLVALLCDLLEIHSPPGSQPAETLGTTSFSSGPVGSSFAMKRNFQPMFFSSDYPFEELFCRTMDLFGRTWKEMKATVQDTDKVRSV